MNFLAKSIKSLGNLPVDVSVPVCMFLPPGGGQLINSYAICIFQFSIKHLLPI